MTEKAEDALIHRANGDFDRLTDVDRSTDDIRRDIEHRRDSIVNTVDRASRKVRDLLAWREQMRDHPYGTLAFAAGVSFVVAGLLRHRTTTGERFAATLTQSVAEIGDSMRDAIDPTGRSRSGITRTVGATLIAMVAQSLIQAAGNRIVTKPQSRSNDRRIP